jgi:hypothetical protein
MTTYICTAELTFFDYRHGEYVSVPLEHYSTASSEDEALYDAREVWEEHGYNPSEITIKLY